MVFRRRLSLVIAVTLSWVSVAVATSSIYMPVERVAAIAPLIVEGVVARTASGFDPATGALSTYVTVDVSYVHRGLADLDRVVVREPGGRFGDLVHVVDAVPVFRPGEAVLLFLEPAKDKALRVAGMFFGKLELRDAATGRRRLARRELSGAGLMLDRPADEFEEFPSSEIEAVIASSRYERAPSGAPPAWLSVPPEFARLRWDDVREIDPSSGALTNGPSTSFVRMSTSYPARWSEADMSVPVSTNIQPGGNPMNDQVAAVNAMKRAMAAWTSVPEARLVLSSGNENYAFTAANAQSPAVVYPPVNIILFDDPYGDVSDPSGCSGTLAIGGYWRSGSNVKTVNGVSFFPLLRQYVIFNNNFQCFLGNADSLAEVAAHELGHGIGFGHSTVADAIMRASAYGNGRGPRLGDDDRDGAHCHYPHALTLTSPIGGEAWQAGSSHAITWTASAEAGPDPGTLDVEFSADGGVTWTVVSAGEPNDGSYPWTVPSAPGAQSVVRVLRHNRVAPTPAPYPEACSLDVSDAAFTVTAVPPAVAGCAPDGRTGSPLRVAKASVGALTITWGASCSATASNYALYEGTLSALRSGSWDHVPRTCAAGLDLAETVTPAAGNSYYLVAPLAGGQEGLLGQTSLGAERPLSRTACAPRETVSCP